MDKIREEFERFLIEDNMEYHEFAMKCKNPKQYKAALGYIAGYKSRDEGVQKLEWYNKNLLLGRDTSREECKRLEAKNKKLRNALEVIMYYTSIEDDEISKSKLLIHIDTTAIEALKDDE